MRELLYFRARYARIGSLATARSRMDVSNNHKTNAPMKNLHSIAPATRRSPLASRKLPKGS